MSPLPDLLAQFLVSKLAAGRSQRTVDWYRDQIGVYIAWVERERIVGWMSTVIVEQYLAQQRTLALAPSTVSARYRALSVFFGWLVERDHLHLDTSPVKAIQRPSVPKKRVRYVTLVEFRRLYGSIQGDNWIDDRDRVLLSLLFWSGLRVSELVSLAPHDVDMTARLVHVREGKGGKDRMVPCEPALGPVLLHYLFRRPVYAGAALFVSNDGYGGVRGRLTSEGVRMMLKRRCLAAKLRYMNPHAFRHGFAMEFLNAGMDLSAVSAAMGHSSEKVTESIYAHWLTEGLSEVYEAARKRLENKRPHNA